MEQVYTPWGHHLVLDCYDANKKLISDKAHIEKFAKRLVQVIDMVPYGEPQVVLFGHRDARGYTLVQLIETSNICAHFSENTGNFYLDVFSCKDFETNKVIEVVGDFFEPKKIRVRELKRD